LADRGNTLPLARDPPIRPGPEVESRRLRGCFGRGGAETPQGWYDSRVPLWDASVWSSLELTVRQSLIVREEWRSL